MAGGLDLFSAQQLIKQYIDDHIVWYVDEGSVPDATTLRYVNGVVDPYIMLRFADAMPTSRGGSFSGAQQDEQYSYFDALCIADSPAYARELGSILRRTVLGKTFYNVGEITPIFGGGQFTIAGDTDHPLTFITLCSFRYATNITDVGAGVL